MSKVAVVYWSATGNTEKMAEVIARGVQDAGSQVEVFTPSNFKANMVDGFDAIAFGCPAMGAEQLEDYEFEPMFNACKSKLKEKNIALFGSYDWGNGEWMRNWEEACKSSGANLVSEGLICHETPDDEAIENCKLLGEAIAKA